MPEQVSKHPHIVVFFGLVASGKSHLAKRFSRARHCPYYNTDIVRKKILGIDPHSRQSAGLSQGIYSAEHTRRTYQELLNRIKEDIFVRSRPMVVLDGSYREPEERNRLVAAGGDRCHLSFIYCYCSVDETKRRLERRALDPHAVSDGRWEIYLDQKRSFEVPQVIAGAHLLLLDTEAETEVLLDTVADFVDRTDR